MEKFVKRFSLLQRLLIFIGVTVTLFGCTSVQIPTYLQDKNPYVKRFYADFDQASAAVNQTLKDLGWTIDRTVSPGVYERRSNDPDDETLIITDTRKTSLVVGTRYAKMNIFIRTKRDVSEIEIRYLTTSSLTFQNFKSYRNDGAIERIFEYIDKTLQDT